MTESDHLSAWSSSKGPINDASTELGAVDSRQSSLFSITRVNAEEGRRVQSYPELQHHHHIPKMIIKLSFDDLFSASLGENGVSVGFLGQITKYCRRVTAGPSQVQFRAKHLEVSLFDGISLNIGRLNQALSAPCPPSTLSSRHVWQVSSSLLGLDSVLSKFPPKTSSSNIK